MIDWQKYPLVLLFLPFLLGTILGYVCTIQWGWTVQDAWLFLSIALSACGLIAYRLLTFRQKKKNGGGNFTLLALSFSLLLGFVLSARSHQQAFRLYGQQYKYEIYKHHALQNRQAQQVQRRLHNRFSSPREGGYFNWAEHPEECALVETMTLGRRSELGKEVRKVFADAGISHLLALSGYHLGILFALLLYLPRRFGCLLHWHRTWLCFTLLVLWLYALMTGMSPSIVRAALMFSLVSLFKMLERRVQLVNSCTLAAFIILVIDPLFVGHIGFQLSFCAVMGIALTEQWIPRGFLLGSSYVCAVCTLATLPLAAYHFGTMALLGLPVNLVATLLVPPIMLLTVCWWMLCWWAGPVADGIAVLLQALAWALLWLARAVARLPFATLAYRPSAVEVVFLYGALLTLVSLLHKVTGRRIIVLLLLLQGAILAAIVRKSGLLLAYLAN